MFPAQGEGRGHSWLGLGWAALALATFGWFAVTRLVVTSDLGVWDVVALRFGGALALLRQCLPRRSRR